LRNLAALVVASLALALATGCAPEVRSPRPNVLLVIVDTLRADQLGVYGSGVGASPSIDAFAEGAVVFERAIASSASTVPSHASIMTSKHVREAAVGFATGEGRLESGDTLAAAFQAAGYATAAFVGNYVLTGTWGFAKGFDHYDAELSRFELNRRAPERLAEETTERALAWLAAHGRGGKPIFLWVHYQDPHGPYHPPEAHRGKVVYPPRPGEQPLPLLRQQTGLRGIPSHQVVPGLELPSAYRSAYADEVLYADHSIGELLAAFEAASGDGGSVVLLTSDHGESFGEGERWFVHGFATTPQLAHVPMILRAPGLAPGRSDEFASHVDVMPTLLALAGIDPGPEVRGLPLGVFLREGLPLPDRYVYCDIGKEVAAYRADGFLRATGLGGYQDTGKARWQRFAWTPGEDWRPLAARAQPDPELRDYVRSGVPFRPVDLDDDTRETLRALGYAVDPVGEPAEVQPGE